MSITAIPWFTVSMIVGLIVLAVSFALVLSYYRQQKKQNELVVMFLSSASITSFRLALPQIKKEIYRVRRYKRPLSVVVIRSRDNLETNHSRQIGLKRSNGHTQRHSDSESISLFEFLLCGPIFRDCIRESDIICFDGDKNHFILVLPESDKDRALKTIQRIQNRLVHRIAGMFSFGVAEYKHDGLLIEDLIEHATNHPVMADSPNLGDSYFRQS
ncbi:MAG: hypothetical protein Kow0037_25590 [Calditrichia bacterium]